MRKSKEIDWKFKKDAEPQGTSDDFYYCLTQGYIRANDALADKDQIKMVNDAIEVLRSFEDAMRDAELIKEF